LASISQRKDEVIDEKRSETCCGVGNNRQGKRKGPGWGGSNLGEIRNRPNEKSNPVRAHPCFGGSEAKNWTGGGVPPGVKKRGALG